ncbi:MAG: hypothetical protein OEV42_06590 [Deltaproteobacteria bacterium]|nr:hypothetical protein [Deltaproteobacteria bacterium]
MKKIICLSLAALLLMKAEASLSAPETVAVRITDVTTSSFSVVWMTDVDAEPELEVAMDSSMSNLINASIEIMTMSGLSPSIKNAAKIKGIMRATVARLEAGKTYYVRAVTRNALNSADVSYSIVLEVTTAAKVAPFTYNTGVAESFSNDLAVFPVYVRPSDSSDKPGEGDLVIIETDNSLYPVSAFVGEGGTLSAGLLDMNNLFDGSGTSMKLAGAERLTLRVYRGDLLFTLTHFRKMSANSGLVYVAEPEKGFFADIDINSIVDDNDFGLFREQYRSLPDDANYNPDYNFVTDTEGKVDVREFSKFALEYGRTDVQ